MKRLFILLIPVLWVSCLLPKPDPEAKQPEYDILEDRVYPLFDPDQISKIVLLIADSSVIDPAHKELPPLARIGSGGSIVDSAGKLAVTPTQQLTIDRGQRDTILAIFNEYLFVPQYKGRDTRCTVLYTHVFQIFDLNGKIAEQVHLCLGCGRLDYIVRGACTKFIEDEPELYQRLIANLRAMGAFLPKHI